MEIKREIRREHQWFLNIKQLKGSSAGKNSETKNKRKELRERSQRIGSQ